MKNALVLAALAMIVSSTFNPICAKETFISLKIGPAWPQALSNSGSSTAWDGELLYGIFVDRKVGFGIATDFLWNTQVNEQRDTSGLLFVTKSEESYMIPVMGFIVFDPIPNSIVHPMLRFEIGYNSLIYNSKTDSTAHPLSKSENGYYYGLIMKLGLDGLYNLGEQTAVFAGLEYQWADTKTNADNNGLFSRRDMSGLGIRMGFRFLL